MKLTEIMKPYLSLIFTLGLFGIWALVCGCTQAVDLGEHGPCRVATDVQGTGNLDQLLGFAMQHPENDESKVPQCVNIAGTECVGSDCEDLFASQDDCELSQEECVKSWLDEYCQDACEKIYECYQGDLVMESCVLACTSAEKQAEPDLCAETALCISQATCDEFLNQKCLWISDCF